MNYPTLDRPTLMKPKCDGNSVAQLKNTTRQGHKPDSKIGKLQRDKLLRRSTTVLKTNNSTRLHSKNN
jgi:hypothetical protein